jgi:hypothetical protein
MQEKFSLGTPFNNVGNVGQAKYITWVWVDEYKYKG